MKDINEMLSTDEAAKLLGLRPQTLRIWRIKGVGPIYVRLSRSALMGRVGYRMSDIEAWISEHSFRHTSEETVASDPFMQSRLSLAF